MITVQQFTDAVDSLQGYFGVYGVFGGNPALHPEFETMCAILRDRVPFEQRGLWCNHPKGNGLSMRSTFCPWHSNLNVHLDREAYDEFCRDWPESREFLKGLDPSWSEAQGLPNHRVGDARHSPVYVAMQDLQFTEQQCIDMIGRCDVNQHWSAMIGVFRGELRGWFCEIAGAQSMLHQHEDQYPNTGHAVVPGWWRAPMAAFDEQVRYHCHACSFPLKGYGELAIGGTTEQVSETHRSIYKPKDKDRLVQLITSPEQMRAGALVRGTDYIQNGGI